MKIYFGHSKDFDFVNEFYKPIENCEALKNNILLFPHKMSINSRNGREFYKDIDLLIAEVSYPATGLGIELGWAFDEGIAIYCFHKNTAKISSSLKSVTNNIIEYNSINELVEKIVSIVQSFESKY